MASPIPGHIDGRMRASRRTRRARAGSFPRATWHLHRSPKPRATNRANSSSAERRGHPLGPERATSGSFLFHDPKLRRSISGRCQKRILRRQEGVRRRRYSESNDFAQTAYIPYCELASPLRSQSPNSRILEERGCGPALAPRRTGEEHRRARSVRARKAREGRNRCVASVERGASGGAR